MSAESDDSEVDVIAAIETWRGRAMAAGWSAAEFDALLELASDDGHISVGSGIVAAFDTDGVTFAATPTDDEVRFEAYVFPDGTRTFAARPPSGFAYVPAQRDGRWRLEFAALAIGGSC